MLSLSINRPGERPSAPAVLFSSEVGARPGDVGSVQQPFEAGGARHCKRHPEPVAFVQPTQLRLVRRAVRPHKVGLQVLLLDFFVLSTDPTSDFRQVFSIEDIFTFLTQFAQERQNRHTVSSAVTAIRWYFRHTTKAAFADSGRWTAVLAELYPVRRTNSPFGYMNKTQQ
jgi:hypothetical protein